MTGQGNSSLLKVWMFKIRSISGAPKRPKSALSQWNADSQVSVCLRCLRNQIWCWSYCSSPGPSHPFIIDCRYNSTTEGYSIKYHINSSQGILHISMKTLKQIWRTQLTAQVFQIFQDFFTWFPGSHWLNAQAFHLDWSLSRWSLPSHSLLSKLVTTSLRLPFHSLIVYN